jgi:hypothetical protein
VPAPSSPAPPVPALDPADLVVLREAQAAMMSANRMVAKIAARARETTDLYRTLLARTGLSQWALDRLGFPRPAAVLWRQAPDVRPESQRVAR